MRAEEKELERKSLVVSIFSLAESTGMPDPVQTRILELSASAEDRRRKRASFSAEAL